MVLSAIEAVRLKSSDKSTITREEDLGTGDHTIFKLSHQRVLTSPDIEVRVNGLITVAFTMDYDNGIVTFAAPPAEGDELEFIYYWSIFSDDEVQYFLDESGQDVTIATAKLLLAIAADASKVAQRQSMAGGGGLGSVTLDTSVTARELRNTAKALLEMERDSGQTIPAEGLTEVIWDEISYQSAIDQSLIRNS